MLLVGWHDKEEAAESEDKGEFDGQRAKGVPGSE